MSFGVYYGKVRLDKSSYLKSEISVTSNILLALAFKHLSGLRPGLCVVTISSPMYASCYLPNHVSLNLPQLIQPWNSIPSIVLIKAYRGQH
jgi:hypothetical protein